MTRVSPSIPIDRVGHLVRIGIQSPDEAGPVSLSDIDGVRVDLAGVEACRCATVGVLGAKDGLVLGLRFNMNVMVSFKKEKKKKTRLSMRGSDGSDGSTYRVWHTLS